MHQEHRYYKVHTTAVCQCHGLTSLENQMIEALRKTLDSCSMSGCGVCNAAREAIEAAQRHTLEVTVSEIKEMIEDQPTVPF